MRETQAILRDIETIKKTSLKQPVSSAAPVLSETEANLITLLERLAIQVDRLDRFVDGLDDRTSMLATFN
jgi:hypothetical protein